MWVKVPSAAASVVCSACLAAAIALPAADMAANGAGQLAQAVQPKAAQLAAASAAFDPFGTLMNAAAGDFFNNAIDNLGQIAAFSALPFYRNILFNLPVPPPAAATASTGQTATDPLNNAIDNLGQIAAFSALPFYRNILLNLPVPVTTASTGQTATDFINNAIDNLGQIAAFSALPFYRNILLNCPVAGCSTTTTTASTGQTVTDPFNNAINNLGQIAAFSALPFYRNILFNLPVGSVGPPITTASTLQGNETNVPPTGKILSTSLPSSGDPGTWTPRWSPTNGKTWDNGGAVTFSPPQNNDPSGSENGNLPDQVVSIAKGGGQGGTSQPEAKPLPVLKKDANRSTADTQSTGNSGNGSFSRKFEPNPIIFENGSRGGAENGMFSGLNGPGGLFGGGKDQASSTGTAAPTSGGPK